MVRILRVIVFEYLCVLARACVCLWGVGRFVGGCEVYECGVCAFIICVGCVSFVCICGLFVLCVFTWGCVCGVVWCGVVWCFCSVICAYAILFLMRSTCVRTICVDVHVNYVL